MSYRLDYAYVAGQYYIDFNHILHIKSTMAEKNKEKFIAQITVDRDETRKRRLEGCLDIRSSDIDFVSIEYDD